MNEYIKKAEDFLTATETTMTVEFVRNGKHFDSDTHNRDIYKVTFKRGRRSFSLEFGQSWVNSAKIVNKQTGDEFTTDGGSLKGNLIIHDITSYKSSYPSGMVREVKGTPPNEYDILACIQKHEVESFEDFCSIYSYDLDSRTAKKTYKAVKKEFSNVCKIWTDDEIELLQEIS